jgi:hypothetical protein
MLLLGSSIVAGNKAFGSGFASGNKPDEGADIYGGFISLGNNLIGNSSGATGFISTDQQNVAPKLNPLADNGGATQTMSLQADSFAIGKGNCALALPAVAVTTDQRGASRKSPCDVGAYESASVPKTR